MGDVNKFHRRIRSPLTSPPCIFIRHASILSVAVLFFRWMCSEFRPEFGLSKELLAAGAKLNVQMNDL
jgi:hypothetical protein